MEAHIDPCFLCDRDGLLFGVLAVVRERVVKLVEQTRRLCLASDMPAGRPVSTAAEATTAFQDGFDFVALGTVDQSAPVPLSYIVPNRQRGPL